MNKLLFVAALAAIAVAASASEDVVEVQQARSSSETRQIEILLDGLVSKINGELNSIRKSYDSAQAKATQEFKEYEKAKGAASNAKSVLSRESALRQKELKLINDLRATLSKLVGANHGTERSKSSVEPFDRNALAGQLIVEAACIAMRPGTGWTFAVRRSCSSGAKTCAQVCSSMRESQAGTLQCFNSIHMYANQAAKDTALDGLKTYRYNGCGGGCGPNYCCCSQKYRSTSDVEESEDDGMNLVGEDELVDGAEDNAEDPADELAEVEQEQGAHKIGTKWDQSGTSGQLLAQATCTAIAPNAWSFAVKRSCSGSYANCATVCSKLTEGQAGRLSCKNSLHLYGNSQHNAVERVGLKVYRYNGCGGGCGPNYCCCWGNGQRSALETSSDIDEDVDETAAVDLAVPAEVDEESNGEVTDVQQGFDQADTAAQALAEATCTALNGGGWTFAVRRECDAQSPSCADVCKHQTEGQVRSMKCFNSLHVYANNPTNSVGSIGMKVYKYGGCGGGCGPNFCCCKNA